MANLSQMREVKPRRVLRPDEDGGSIPRREAPYHELDMLIRRAEIMVEDVPDGAALVLDGLLLRLASLALDWERISVEPDNLLAQVEEQAPALAAQLRLALRAPSVEARVIHARKCLQALAGVPPAVVHENGQRANDVSGNIERKGGPECR